MIFKQLNEYQENTKEELNELKKAMQGINLIKRNFERELNRYPRNGKLKKLKMEMENSVEILINRQGQMEKRRRKNEQNI